MKYKLDMLLGVCNYSPKAVFEILSSAFDFVEFSPYYNGTGLIFFEPVDLRKFIDFFIRKLLQ